MKQFLLRLKNKQTLLFIAIIILGAFFRLYQLNHIPAGLYWDEAAISYNAWGISVWNRDEFGNKLPISFKSFGDYKAPLFIYSLAAIYKITGLHIEYVRLFSALCGVINIALIYWLAKSFKRSGLVSAFIMATVPWAINFSRIGSEAVLALTLLLSGLVALSHLKQKPWLIYLASLSFGFSFYVYHSIKIFLPLFLCGLIVLYGRKIKLQYLASGLLLLGILLIPLANDTVNGQGFERGKTMIMYQDGKIAAPNVIVTKFTQNVASYLSFNFWTVGNDAIGLRHNVPGHGVIYWSLLSLMIVGIIQGLIKHPRIDLVLILWLAAGLMPSLLSGDAPHAIRSMLALPAVIFLAVSGFEWLIQKRIFLILIPIYLIEVGLYLQAYYGPYSNTSATAFQYGYKQAIQYAESVATGDDKIIMTDTYGQPYIYTLLYRRIKPEEFKFGALANYEFHTVKWPDANPHRIFVATPAEIPVSDSKVIKVIYSPDGRTPAFVIAKNN